MRKIFRIILCAMLLLTLTATPLMATLSSSALAAGTMKMVKVNVQGGRLRKGPSSSYDVITSLDKGDKIFYSGQTKNAFSYVCTADGKVGYIYKEFLTSYGSVRSSSIYYTTGKNVRMYKKASTSASKAATLRKQQFVIVYKKAGKWAYVRTLDGQAGYVQLSKLKNAGW